MARRFLDLRPDMAKSTMDSSDVAQVLISPGKALDSHSVRVFFMEEAISELGSTERRERMSGSLDEEKGIESATWLGRSKAPER